MTPPDAGRVAEEIVLEYGSAHFITCASPYGGEIDGRLHLCGCQIGDQNRKLLDAITTALTTQAETIRRYSEEVSDLKDHIDTLGIALAEDHEQQRVMRETIRRLEEELRVAMSQLVSSDVRPCAVHQEYQRGCVRCLFTLADTQRETIRRLEGRIKELEAGKA